MYANDILAHHSGAVKKRLTTALSPIHYVVDRPLKEFQENMTETCINENHPDLLPYFFGI
jgi:hypothetical protein